MDICGTGCGWLEAALKKTAVDGIILLEYAMLGGTTPRSSQGAPSASEGGAKGAGTTLETANPVVVNGSRAIDKAQSYESGIRGMYGGTTAFEERQFEAIVDGKIVNGVADEVITLGGNRGQVRR